MKKLPLGPLMIDIQGTELSDLDRERLTHPLVGGIILFSRNFVDVEQLERLTAAIHELRSPGLLIAADHEGGRVQRFREGFTRLPAMASLGKAWDNNPENAIALAGHVGYVLAAELRARGVDFSFTPVLDLDYGRSSVVGTRSFHRKPEVVIALAAALIEGLKRGGMASCGKHFPGHGWAEADSHVATSVDERTLEALQEDIEPYRELPLTAVMPAHVVYPEFDSKSSGFSNKWNDYLRNNVKFSGVVFSDDLSMEGAGTAGGVLERVQAAYDAGCDMLLLCNAPDKVGTVLESWHPEYRPECSTRIRSLLPAGLTLNWAQLQEEYMYQCGVAAIETLLE